MLCLCLDWWEAVLWAALGWLITAWCTGPGAGGRLYWVQAVGWLLTGAGIIGAGITVALAGGDIGGPVLRPVPLLVSVFVLNMYRALSSKSLTQLQASGCSWWCVDCCVLPPELSVPQGQPPGAEGHDLVLPGLGVSLSPSWFCSMMWSPISRGGSSLVPCFSLSCILADLGANASSLQSATSFQVSLNSVWHVICAFGFVPGKKSCRSRPRSICAGDMPVSWSGVFLKVRTPFTSGTGSSSPLGLTESLITLLADPTDLSAFWLPWGNPSE